MAVGHPTEGQPAVPESLRTFLLFVFLFGVLGVGAELLLIGHYEDLWQWIPLVLLSLGLLASFGRWLRPGSATSVFFRLVMTLFVVGGAVGLALHLKGNAEFEKEMVPSLGGLDLIWESLRGATPALAPGTMILLGLLGWATTMFHPILRSSAGGRDGGEDERKERYEDPR